MTAEQTSDNQSGAVAAPLRPSYDLPIENQVSKHVKSETAASLDETNNTSDSALNDTKNTDGVNKIFLESISTALRTSATQLETTRRHETELEAWTIFASSILKYAGSQQNSRLDNSIVGAGAGKNNSSGTTSNVLVIPLESSLSSNTLDFNKATGSFIPTGVAEAWKALADSIPGSDEYDNSLIIKNAVASNTEVKIPISGSISRALITNCLSQSVNKMSTLASIVMNDRSDDSAVSTKFKRSIEVLQSSKNDNPLTYHNDWMTILDERLSEIHTYHEEHGTTEDQATMLQQFSNNKLELLNQNKRQKRYFTTGISQSTESDGYDIAATVRHWANSVLYESGLSQGVETTNIQHNSLSSIIGKTVDRTYRSDELFGKYVDLQSHYEYFVENCYPYLSSIDTNNIRPKQSTYQYSDFLEDISKRAMIYKWKEEMKLQNRKTYLRFLADIECYFRGFLSRTVPLLDIDKYVVEPELDNFESIWRKTGGYSVGSWMEKASDALLATSNENSEEKILSETDSSTTTIDLSTYESPQQLATTIDHHAIKSELVRLGLKAGGTPLQCSERIFLLKTRALSELPPKVFVDRDRFKKVSELGSSSKVSVVNSAVSMTGTIGTSNISAKTISKKGGRIDIARRECVVCALIDQVRPTIEATVRRLVRRQTQTIAERERDIEEDLYGSGNVTVTTKNRKVIGGDAGDDDDDDSDDDAPIYNPKNVPLDFDGRPIPYWLFKLHGLNHYYKCEICNDEMYRGRRAFELHFAEQKHAIGMKSLGIPNTKHFHGVTKIEDAQALWNQLQQTLDIDASIGALAGGEEEYEDSHGNVVSRSMYEELARQGLL